MRKYIQIIYVILALFWIDSKAYGQIAAWDFFGLSSPATSNVTICNANLDTTGILKTITRGDSAASNGASNSFRTTGFRSNGISTSNADYFQIKLKAKTGYTLSLNSIDARYAGTGTYYASPGVTSQYAYSLDGTTFTLIGSPITSTSLTPSTISLSSITALQNVSSSVTVTIRYYASGQTATGGWGYTSSSAGSYGLSIGGSLNTSGCTGTPSAGTASASSTSVCSGSTTTLSLAGASSGTGITYQWQSSSTLGGTYTDISGATNSIYNTASLSSDVYYKCITTCTTSTLSASSNVVGITVTPTVTPTITTNITPSAIVCSGNSVTFSTSITNGGSTPTYQWRRNSINISGATTASYTYTPTNGDIINCILNSNATCATSSTVTSTATTITVNPLPNPILTGSTTITSGSSAVLTFSGSNGDSVFYWNGTTSTNLVIGASGSNTLTVSPTTSTTYSVTSAKNTYGCVKTVTDQIATITVTTPSSSDTIPTRDNNMAMGNPSSAVTSLSTPNNYLLVRSQYALSYNNSKGIPNWVSWHLSRAWKDTAARCNCFTQDPALPSSFFRASTTDYTGTGFDRGHICPSDDRDGSDTDNAATFRMSNITPQAPILNQQTWGALEEYCRGLIGNGYEMYIISGGYGSGGESSLGGTYTSIASGNISVPSHFWKIVVILPVGINDVSRVTTSTRVIAVIMPNTQSANAHSWDYYRTTVDSIEALTGYDFLSNVSTTIQNVIEANIDNGPTSLVAWDLTGLSSPSTATATFINPNVDSTSTYNTLTRGTSAASSTASNSFRTTGFQNNGISTSNTDYFQFILKPKAGYTLSLSGIEARYSGTASFYASPGVTSQYAYSLNGSTFTLIGSPVTSTNLTPPTIDLSGISALQNLSSSQTVYIRYYASGQTTTGGWGYYSPYDGTYGLSVTGTLNAGCSGTPTVGSAIASSYNLCTGSTTTLSLGGYSTGSGITYQWQSSNTGGTGTYSNISGATSTTYVTPSLSATRYYRCFSRCTASGLADTSNVDTINVSSPVTPTISISTSSLSLCSGISSTISNSITNGGSTPNYQWIKNGINISGATSSSFSYIPTNSDIISCKLTSNATCRTVDTAISNTLTYTVTPSVTPTINITSDAGSPLCSATTVNYSSSISNGGTTPTYQWTKNSTDISGATSNSYSYVPSNGDIIRCRLISDAICATTNTVTSTSITNTVTTAPTAGTISGASTVYIGGNTTLTNIGATSGTQVWSSSNTSVATVSSGGLVYGVSNGSTTISFSVSNGCGTASTYTVISVTSLPSILAAWNCFGASSPSTLAAARFDSTAIIYTSSANNLTRGSGASSSTASNSFRTTGFADNGISTSNIDYFQITLKPNSGFTLSLSTIDANFAGTATYCASPGVSSQFAYSLNGTTFTLIGTAQNLIGTPVSLSTINVSGISDLQNIPSGTTVYLRYYASGQTSTGGWGLYSSTSTEHGLTIRGNSNYIGCTDTPSAGVVSATATTLCSGSSTTLTLSGATVATGVGYQWQSSSSGAAGSYTNISGATNTTYNSGALTATRYYRCVSSCSYYGMSDTSTVQLITVNPNLTPTVSINAASNRVCAGNTISFTTTIVNGGSSPSYQWKKNSINITGATNDNYTYLPSNGDIISCTITSSETCLTSTTANSNNVTITVDSGLPSAGTITGTTSVAVGATTTLANTTASSGTSNWSSSYPSVASVNSSGVVNGVLVGNSIITYTVTNGCGSAFDTAIINVVNGTITIAAWDMTGYNNTSVVPAAVYNTNLTLDSNEYNITRGPGAASSAASNSFRTTGFSNNGIATTNTDYFQVTLQAKPGYTLSIANINARYGGTTTYYASPGVTSQYAYSLDGITFTLIGSPNTSTSFTSPTITTSSISALQNIPAGTKVYIRYYASGQTTTGGWGFNSPSSGQYGLAIGGNLNYIGCSSSPSSGIITSLDSTLCAYDTANITLSGYTTDYGISYQWQADTGLGFYDIPYNTTNLSTNLFSDTVQIRCKTTCVPYNLTSYSNNTTLYIKENYRPSVFITNGSLANVCSGNNIDIIASVVPNNASISYNWRKNNIPLLVADSIYSYYPTSSDTISIFLNSSYECYRPYNTSDTIIVNTVNAPYLLVDSVSQPCYGGSANVYLSSNAGNTLFYKIGSGDIQTYNFTSSNGVISVPSITSDIIFKIISISNASCNINIDSNITISSQNYTWIGGSTGHENDWSFASNWSCGYVPTEGSNVIIPYTSFIPNLATTVHLNNLTINPNTEVNISPSEIISINNDLINHGKIKGSIEFSGTATQHISGKGEIYKLYINNTTGVLISSTSNLKINKELNIVAGYLYTNDSLILNSDSTATAYVSPITCSTCGIIGNVNMMQYIPGGRRAYRFISHPFNSSITLNQIQEYIDITGTGGAVNGFTSTGSNASSAFWYNTYNGNSTLSYDPGWRAFTNTYGIGDTNMISKHQGIRLFIRGSKGQGLGYDTYTPAATTIHLFGNINQGTQAIKLKKGSSPGQDYNLIGNPYPSAINLGGIMHRAKVEGKIVGGAYYVWNPYMASNGIFQAIPVNTLSATPYYIQPLSAFEVRAALNNDSINIYETDKTNNISTNLLRTVNNTIEIYLKDSNGKYWDMLTIGINDECSDSLDDWDGFKLENPEANIYSGFNTGKLAIDYRKNIQLERIPIFITNLKESKYTLEIKNNISDNLYLYDNVENKKIAIGSSISYSFNSKQPFYNRFAIGGKGNLIEKLDYEIYPNPTNGIISVKNISENETVMFSVYDIKGQIIVQGDINSTKNIIDISKYPSGTYLIMLSNNKNNKISYSLRKD